MKQVVSISPEGTVSGLQHKKGFDLRPMGPVSITRASEIVWDETEQHWRVEFKDAGSLSGKVLTVELAEQALGFAWYGVLDHKQLSNDKHLLFNDYEAAVHAEVTVLDAMRLAGQL